MTRVYIITGEASGDILASRLMRAMRESMPPTEGGAMAVCTEDSPAAGGGGKLSVSHSLDASNVVEFFGVGGETMTAAEGFESLFPMSDLSVMGFWEVVPRLPLIFRRVRQVVKDIEAKKPDVVVTVDSWGFVTQVLKKLVKRGSKIPRVHYVAPQVWAWKKGRAKQTAQLVDRLMTLWPNEPPLFEKFGLRSDFVGHPVIENTGFGMDEGTGGEGSGVENDGVERRNNLLCLLPGSRHSEVKRLAPIFKRVAQRLLKEYPDLEFVIPTVDAMADEVGKAFEGLPHTLVRGQQARYDAFRQSAIAIAASGTVSLELAACGTPHLIAYRFSALTNRVVKALVRTPFANIINILSNREIIPEFVLGNCREELILEGAKWLIDSEEQRREQLAGSAAVLRTLKPEGMMPSEKAASIVQDEAL